MAKPNEPMLFGEIQALLVRAWDAGGEGDGSNLAFTAEEMRQVCEEALRVRGELAGIRELIDKALPTKRHGE